MSWMDSWSRPTKSQATPPPLYLTAGDSVPYCHSCGRVIGQRKTHASQEVKYCSSRCRSHKPREIDRKIETVFAALLDGASPESLKEGDVQGTGGPVEGTQEKSKGGGKKKKAVKGDPRIIVECATVEEIMFPREKDPTKVFGRRKNRAARGVVENPDEWRSVDMVDEPEPAAAAQPPPAPGTASDKSNTSDSEPEQAPSGIALATDHPEEKVEYGFGSGKVRPPKAQSDINGSIGGEKGWAERIHETDEMKAKRKEGERRAEEKEMVKRAARRGVAFGFGEGEEKRKCEAVMKGVVVESSFAKGEWGIRWREKV